MPNPPSLSNEILAVALSSLEAQSKKIEEHILQVRALLGIEPKRRGRPPKNLAASDSDGSLPAPFRKRRGMSPAARKKMADMMRKRWAAAKKAGKTTIG